MRIFDCLCIFGGKGFLFRYSYQWRPCDRLLHRRNSIPAFGSSSLPTIVAAAYGRASAAKHAPQAPRVGAHDVILTGLDEEGDSTDDEMPPLEPLEGAAQLGVVWLRGHGKDGCDPTSAKLALQLRATQLGGPQAGGAQLGGPHLDVGLID